MKTNPLAVALSAKGPRDLYYRGRSITRRYGLSPTRIDRALRQFSEVLHSFDCGATFPITAVSLKRHGHIIAQYLDQNIEFAVHGYTHIDYAQLAPEEQLAHLRRARQVFMAAGIEPAGFRSPYLRRDTSLYAAIKAAGFCYVSNQPIVWDVLDASAFTPPTCAGYQRALTFYAPWQAAERPSLPCMTGQLVEIPVSLPDDEILIERLGETHGLVGQTWLRILAQTHQRGELFTLQLHPERIAACIDGLTAVLAEARALTPAVWCARLSDIAAWWNARASVTVEIDNTGDGGFAIRVSAPVGTTILARAVQIDLPTELWADGYQQVAAQMFTVHTPLRPVIGLSPDTSPALGRFLREQGYVVEINGDSRGYAYYFDQPEFASDNERRLLIQIEQAGLPLVRLGRWPQGARSALAITGDIDALTLWDYGLRLFGK